LVSLPPVLFWIVLFAVIIPRVPAGSRPPIFANAIYDAEKFLFFGAPSYRMVSSVTECENRFFDILAAVAYGIHFFFPPAFGVILLIAHWHYAPALAYYWCWGFLNGLAVLTQFIFPTAPPWYIEKYPNLEASYAVHGDPAGLICFDTHVIHRPFFTNIYSHSPVVFGAFPSLHAAWPFLIALFCLPNIGTRMLGWLYVVWVWWAAMYLRHHYLLDLLGGAAYCLFIWHFLLPIHSRLVPRLAREEPSRELDV
jgi:hypothetical protein